MASITLTSLAAVSPAEPPPATQPAPERKAVFDPENPYATGPFVLLDFLRGSGFCHDLPREKAPGGWISRRDAQRLMLLIESEEPARHVCSAWSSRFTFDDSTVGEQARFLIEGHLEDRYPPSADSIAGMVRTVEEIVERWRKRYGPL